MNTCVVPDSTWGKALLLIWLVIEAWLGKTDKTRASSTLGLLAMGIVTVLKYIWSKLWKKPTT